MRIKWTEDRVLLSGARVHAGEEMEVMEDEGRALIQNGVAEEATAKRSGKAVAADGGE